MVGYQRCSCRELTLLTAELNTSENIKLCCPILGETHSVSAVPLVLRVTTLARTTILLAYYLHY